MALSESIAQSVRQFVLSNSKSKRRQLRKASRFTAERLEDRRMLSVVPNPIIPSTGEANQLLQAVQQAAKGNTNALDNFPVPFAVQYSGGGAAPQVVNWHAGAPLKLDVDNSKSTGNGGNDIQVDVETVLTPTPHLTMEIDRLGSAPFAQNVNVLIAFPFNAFDSELLPSVPNLVIGYQTGAVGGGVGGIAPVSELITFTPHILAGTNHLFDLNFATTGASNPIQFETGEFDGINTTGPLNARVIAAYVQNVPSSINVGLNVAQSALTTLPSSGSIGVTWDASSSTPVTFGYLEDVSAPNPLAPNFNTTLSFNQMPTHEQISLSANETAGTITVSSQSNAPIGAVTLQTTRSDGLTITGTASGVPTALDLSFAMAGTVTVNTHGSILGGLSVTAQQTGGFFNTASFLGYNIGYAQLALTNVPSLTAGFIPGIDAYGVQTLVPGTAIGSVSILISKDQNVQLPPSGLWGNPNWDIFSLVDNGTTGTAAARIDDAQQATFNANAASISDLFTLTTTAPHPMEAYLRTTPSSNLIPGHDVEVTADIMNFPGGTTSFTANFPAFSYTTNPAQTINDVHIFGHIDSTNFDIDAGSLPPVFSFDFDPDSHATIVAQDGMGNPATVGHIAAHLFTTDGSGLPGSGALFGTPLNDAFIRFDQIPSLHATWSNSGSTTVNYSPDVSGFFIAGAQLELSTVHDLPTLTAASASSPDSVTLLDKGSGMEKQLDAGAFGISGFTLNTNDPSHQFTLSYSANQPHLLTVNVNSAFGGRYFPNYAINEALTIDSIPGTFNLTTDMASSFVYTASAAIASVTLGGSIDDTNDGVNNPTNTVFMASGLPASVNFNLDTSAKKATLTMSDQINNIAFALSNDTADIFGTPYRLVTATMSDIPAHWKVDWSGGGLDVEAEDASNNPAPMGVVAATISTSDNPTDIANFLHPFQISGPGGARINYSAFLQDIDDRFYQAGGSPDAGAATIAILNDIYNNAHTLQAGEDHAVAQVNGGSLVFFDGQFTGFQKISYAPNSNGGDFEFDAPSPGTHPFFAGVGLDSNFLYASIDNVPASSTLHIDTTGDIHFHASSSPGTIDVYYGPAGMAQDSDTALRAQLQNTPTDVDLSWNFGFPNGGATFTASNPFTLLFLAQNGSDRLVGALRLQNLRAGYNIQILPLTVSSSTALGIPTSATLVLFKASAGIDNNTSGTFGVGNPSLPGVSGIFNLYSMTASPESINDGTAPGGPQYTPVVTFQMKDFTQVQYSIELDMTIISLDPLNLPGTPHVNSTLTGPDGQFGLQLWSSDDINDTFLGIIGFVNKPDYVDNTPFFIIPFGSPQLTDLGGLVFTFGGFGTFSDLFDAFD